MKNVNYRFTKYDGVLSLRVFAKPIPKQTFFSKLKEFFFIIVVTFVPAVLELAADDFDTETILIICGSAFFPLLLIHFSVLTERNVWFTKGFEELQINPVKKKITFFRVRRFKFNKNTFSFKGFRYFGELATLYYTYNVSQIVKGATTDIDNEETLCLLFKKRKFLFKKNYLIEFGAALTDHEVIEVKRVIEHFLNKHEVEMKIEGK